MQAAQLSIFAFSRQYHVAALHAGSCTITANQAGGNGDYDMAAEVSQSFTIAEAAATLITRLTSG